MSPLARILLPMAAIVNAALAATSGLGAVVYLAGEPVSHHDHDTFVGDAHHHAEDLSAPHEHSHGPSTPPHVHVAVGLESIAPPSPVAPPIGAACAASHEFAAVTQLSSSRRSRSNGAGDPRCLGPPHPPRCLPLLI